MSREYLTGVLNKFAQVTSILVETSKIKEYLDNKCTNDNDLKIILDRTKTEVENLCNHSASVKDLFYKQYREVLANLNSDNDKENGDEQQNGIVSEQNDPLESCDVNCNQAEDTKKTNMFNKPLIKLVDINKLVEPKTLMKQIPSPVKEKNNVEMDSTIVIITSSDEETSKITRTKVANRIKMNSKRKAARETIKKTRQALQAHTSSESELTDDDRNLKRSRVKNGSRRRAKIDEKVTLSDTSLSVSDASDSTTTRKKSHVATGTEKNEIQEAEEQDWKKDPKFNGECYVKMLRIPCERLKEYYLERLELLDIKKLRNLILKRKQSKKSPSEKSSGSEDLEPRKKKAKRVSFAEKVASSDTEDSSSTDIEKAKSSDDFPLSKSPDHREESAQAAELALELLNSDKEDDKNDSDKETEAPKEAEASPEEKTDDDKKQETESNEKEDGEAVKDDEKKENDEQKEEANSNAEGEEKEKDGENKDEDGAKKQWRRDKLLTMKLSSSDSAEEFQKFCKKKEKMQDEVASDEDEKVAKDKKKRLTKKRMKKAILSDSDSDSDKNKDEDFQKPNSSSSSSESEVEKEEEKKKPARKRVKRVKDSSDEDDEEKSTRKQIRNIWGRDSLAETTKQAEAEEKERKARIVEKQKKYNQIYENASEINASVEKVVLDFDEKNNKELLKVDDRLVKKLKPHQASGVQFMWDACFESLERAKTTKGSGCILAHCMGLGKTLQVITLTHTLLVNGEETKVKKVMVVSPLNTVLNWVSEYKQWLPDSDDFEVFELVSFKQNYERMYQVKNWHNFGGVLIIGYDMFRNLSNPNNKKISKKLRAIFHEAMVDPGPDLVICDEGHLLKNEKTHLSIAMNRLKTMRRIVLTGTPLQNNLKEYFCMVQFIKPNLLGTYKEYLNRFVNPITNGQYTDSTPHDIQVMRRRSHVLHKMLDGVVQRRDYSVLQPYLPPKHEYILFLNLTDIQIQLYQHYMDHFARRNVDGSNRTSFLFVDFQALQRICAHPRVLLDRSIELKNAKDKYTESDEEESEGSLKDFINDSTSASDSSSDEDEGKSPSNNRPRMTRSAAALAVENGEDPIVVEEERQENPKREWWQDYCDGDELNVIGHSTKLFLLFEILKECEQIGDKVLVFSQSLYSLNVIEYFLGRIHDATQSGDTESTGYSESWCLGLDYFRLDGTSSCDNRSIWCKIFNDPSNTRARLFLISTKAGGLGINLVGANRVVIFDVSWNPSHDVQSIYRVYRFGQTKPCYVYRFVTNGAMEMKIYERQVTKQAISKRVIDEQQIDRHYNQNDLAELYNFDPKREDRPIPLVPKDVLLGELLQKYEDKIYKYHEHQSLLENKEEECLNEEERKAAWEEFENEKKQRNTLGSNNYFRQSNMALAIINLLKKENPAWTDAQVMSMVPTLQVQLQEQIAQGDLSFYNRIQQELQIIQALQHQRIKEQFYQQQSFRMMQQQQMAAAMRLQNSGSYLEHFLSQMPGPSRASAPPAKGLNSNEVIDLND